MTQPDLLSSVAIEALIERLRKFAGPECQCKACNYFRQAADTLEALLRERIRLQGVYRRLGEQRKSLKYSANLLESTHKAMGRSAEFYCKTCRVVHDLGYGSAVTWLDDCKSVAEYDQRVAADPSLGELAKNQAMRAALERHAGHEFFTGSRDWIHSHKDGRLCGEFGYGGSCQTILTDFNEWTRE